MIGVIYVAPYTAWPSLAPPCSAFYPLLLCAHCCSWPCAFGLTVRFSAIRCESTVSVLGCAPRRAFDRLTSASFNQPSSQAAVRDVNVLSITVHEVRRAAPLKFYICNPCLSIQSAIRSSPLNFFLFCPTGIVYCISPLLALSRSHLLLIPSISAAFPIG